MIDNRRLIEAAKSTDSEFTRLLGSQLEKALEMLEILSEQVQELTDNDKAYADKIDKSISFKAVDEFIK